MNLPPDRQRIENRSHKFHIRMPMEQLRKMEIPKRMRPQRALKSYDLLFNTYTNVHYYFIAS